MKNVYFLLLFFTQALFLQAASIAVSIENNSFSAIQSTLAIGDVITWTNMGSTHTVTSVSVPSGATTFDSGNLANGATYQYTVTVAGDYTYFCKIHGSSMNGSFKVAGTTTAAAKPTLTLDALYPNPAIDNVHIESAKTITMVDVYSETGSIIKTVTFSSTKIDLPVGELKKGTYLIRIVSEDGLSETRRIVKM